MSCTASLTLEEAAKRAGVTTDDAQRELFSAKQKLLAARALRPTPYIDKTIYTSWNALAISAYLEAGRVLDMRRAAAVRTENAGAHHE